MATALPPPQISAQPLAIAAFYEGRLLVKLADLRTDQVVEQRRYRAGARLTTVGALGFIKPSVLLDQTEGAMAGPTPQPERFEQIEKNGTKHRVVRFPPGGGPRSVADPLTQLLRAALQPGSASPCLGALPVYDGRQRYELALNPLGVGRLEGAAATQGLAKPIACRMAFRPIAGFTDKPKPNPFLRGDPVATFAYSPTGDAWVLADVALPTMLGTAHIALTRLTVTGRRPAPLAPLAPSKYPARRPR